VEGRCRNGGVSIGGGPRAFRRVSRIGKSAIHEMTRLSEKLPRGARVSTTPRAAFGPTGERCLRLS
jgi:aspartate/methionine/tyrosine aminotransferase